MLLYYLNFLLKGSLLREGKTRKVKGNTVRKKSNYVEPLFSIKILPITMNLPMVCPPLAWEYRCRPLGVNEVPRFDQLTGAYLSIEGGELMSHYRLLTSNDYDHFHVSFNDKESYKTLCSILTDIQSVPYKVNKPMLDFLTQNKEKLEEAGLLEPSILAKVNPATLREEIRHLLSRSIKIVI